jgi:hypothetical protein
MTPRRQRRLVEPSSNRQESHRNSCREVKRSFFSLTSSTSGLGKPKAGRPHLGFLLQNSHAAAPITNTTAARTHPQRRPRPQQRPYSPVPLSLIVAAPRPTPHPFSPFRRLLPFGLDEFFDVPLERRPHRRRPPEFFVQMISAFGATGDMLFDSAHLRLGEFLQGVALHHHD